METTKINLGGEPQGKKETEKLNVVTAAAENSQAAASEPVEETGENSPQEESKKRGLGAIGRMAAAAVGGAALGGGVAMAAGLGVDADAGEDPEPVPAPAPKPTPQEQEAPVAPEEAEDPIEAPEPIEAPSPTPATTDATTDETSGGPTPEPDIDTQIEEILVDPDDIDGERVMNVEGTGVVEVEGVEYGAAMVTDDEGNTYYLVDVDGEVNDPNATYDIIIDAENGEVGSVPINLTQSDAQLMAEGGVAYVEPIVGDTNNVAQAEMAEDVYDPASGQPLAEEEPYMPEETFDPMADNIAGDGMDLIDPMS